MGRHITRGNATRARVLAHAFVWRTRSPQRSVPRGRWCVLLGLARAMAKITLANLTYDTRRLVWIDGRTAPARPALQRGSEPNFLRFGPATTLEPVSAHCAMATRRRSPPIETAYSRCLIDVSSAG